jgi:hypothetical protein
MAYISLVVILSLSVILYLGREALGHVPRGLKPLPGPKGLTKTLSVHRLYSLTRNA